MWFIEMHAVTFKASSQSLPTVQFWSLEEEEGLGVFVDHDSDTNVYLGRQKGEGSWLKECVFHTFFVQNNKQ